MQAYRDERLKGTDPCEAYRRVYGKLRTVSKGEMDRRVYDLERDERIAPVIAANVQKAAEGAAFGQRDLFQRWVDQLAIDPDEIISHRRTCCRYCHGVNYAYQWREADYAAAVSAAVARNQMPPDAAGGFGFNATLDPMPHCPQCDGEGAGHVRIADTRRLSPGARQMIKKIKQSADGSIEVELHDPKRTEEMLAKTLGMFKDTLDITALMGVIKGDVSDEERLVLEAALRRQYSDET
jgi:phage terminase small subunit